MAPRLDQPGHVYFAASSTGPIKIGLTTQEPRKRVHHLHLAAMRESGASLTLIGAVPGTRVEESALHDLMSHLRTVGPLCGYEWFKPCDELDATIADVLHGRGIVGVLESARSYRVDRIVEEYLRLPEYLRARVLAALDLAPLAADALRAPTPAQATARRARKAA